MNMLFKTPLIWYNIMYSYDSFLKQADYEAVRGEPGTDAEETSGGEGRVRSETA